MIAVRAMKRYTTNLRFVSQVLFFCRFTESDLSPDIFEIVIVKIGKGIIFP